MASLDVKLVTKDQDLTSNESPDRNNESSADQTML
jgi:hypothetical protein